MTEKTNSIDLESSDAPTTSVTVFTDRAEVTRTIRRLIPQGSSEFVLGFLPSNIDRSSVRVSGDFGKSILLEVTSQSKQKKITEKYVDPLEGKKESLVKTREGLEREIAAIDNEKNWLSGFATSVLNPKGSELPSEGKLNDVQNFLTFYGKQWRTLEEKSAEVQDRKKEVSKELDAIVQEIVDNSRKHNYGSQYFSEIVIALEATEETEVLLCLHYITHGASWVASYDVRVNSENKTLEASYYGNITNNSGENWNDVNVTLSTAKPGVGGAPPKLVTKYISTASVSTRNSESVYGGLTNRMVLSNVTPTLPPMQQQWMTAPMMEQDSRMMAQQEINAPVGLGKVNDAGHTCTFAIQRKYTLESDGKPHKVTIGITKLTADFSYETIPRLQTDAFLKASIKNTSNGTFLPGDMNIFMDGNFVSKSEMRLINPEEKFTIFLGVDSGVKVLHISLGSHKDTSSSLFSKKKNSLNVKSKVIVKNFKKHPIRIAIYEQLPKSSDGEIKVALIHPEPTSDDGKNKDESVKVTEANNVRWWCSLPPGEERTLPFEYSVEYSTSVNLDMSFV